MSVVYQLLVSPFLAKAYLEDGLDHFYGFAVEANEVSDVTDVADLIELLRGDVGDSPFSPDEPIDVLHVPISPFVRARQAVGPLHEEAWLGGITEDPPFDGTGVASAAGVTTALLWVEPTRLSIGSKLWRFHPGNPIPQLRGIYHGVAWGWETLAEGTFRAAVPSTIIGPVVAREWGVAAVDVDVQGSQPAAVTLVARDKPAEDGFEPLPSGLWTKRLEGNADLDIHEMQWVGRINDVPVRLIRTLRGADGTLLAHAVSLLLDAPYVMERGFAREAPGVLSIVHPFDEVEAAQKREVRIKNWDMSDFGPIGLQPTTPRDNGDVEQLMAEAANVLETIAPANWTEARVIVQIVGQRADFSASFTIGDESVALASLPNAFMQYVGQLKKALAKPGLGAPLALTLTYGADGAASLDAAFDEAPPFVDRVTAAEWQRELRDFPRSSLPTPAWAAERFPG
ncbi:MAG: hypothetical protein Q3979_08655 [Actinomycetaceae bacterium]|nr:hypothetical protein [Actinomycetaceae bacterium]